MKIKLDGLGRFVLPKIMRKALGLNPDSEIQIKLEGKKIIITKAKEEK